MSEARASLVSAAEMVDLDSDRYAWRIYAACRAHPDVNFFPRQGESTARPKAVCASCPVREVCLQVAITNGDHHGIWGGKSERERRGIRAQIRTTNAKEQP